MCINTISAIWHWQQKEQEQLQLSATKINKENKVHDVWVWVFVCVYFCWRKHLQATHFAITFPILPKISLKTKTVKTQRGWSGKNPRDYLIQLSHFTDKKPEAQGGWNVLSTIVLFFDGGTRTLEKYIDLSSTRALRWNTDGFPVTGIDWWKLIWYIYYSELFTLGHQRPHLENYYSQAS